MRLNKYLASCGICSRRAADELIAAGKVKVNGIPAVTGQTINEWDTVTVEGRPAVAENPVMIALWKPAGVVSGTTEKDRAPVVTDLVDAGTRLFPVGRLDKDSEGLMLLTNMGDLSEKIAKAGNRHEKEYEVIVSAPVTDGFLASLEKGVYITLEENGKEYRYKTKKAKVNRIAGDSFAIIITEGKNRQIRKMCEELGKKVISLKRTRIVNITLEGLAPGKWRKLSEDEIQKLETNL